jgi:Zn-finger nucleic acid-binding protein
MDCPVCSNTKLVMSERQGIEIDYCPTCRGVWLDRGELDKIIDKSAEVVSEPVRQRVANDPYQGQQRQPQGFGHSQQSHDYPQHGYYKKKRKGFLGELFDFD